MVERCTGAESSATNNWDVFVEKTDELDFNKLHEKDPEGFELVREFFEIRGCRLRMSESDYKKTLANFGEKLENFIGDDDAKSDTLTPFFTRIRDM